MYLEMKQDYGLVILMSEVSDKFAKFKYKKLSPDLKRVVIAKLHHNEEREYRFIHEQALYQFMTLGTSQYCMDFQKWVGEIASEMDLLNIRCCDGYLGAEQKSDYDIIKQFIEMMSDDTPINKTVKASMDRLDKAFKNPTITITEKPIIAERKEFRTDFTLDEANENPYYNVNKSREEIENEGNFPTYAELVEEVKKEMCEKE